MVLWLGFCLEGSGADQSSGKYLQVFSNCCCLQWRFSLTLRFFIDLFDTFFHLSRKHCMCLSVLKLAPILNKLTSFISASFKVAPPARHIRAWWFLEHIFTQKSKQTWHKMRVVCACVSLVLWHYTFVHILCIFIFCSLLKGCRVWLKVSV